MRKKSLRRIFTAIFSAVFVFSTVMCTVPAFAGSGDKTDLVTVSNSDAQTVDYNSTEKNVLKEKKPYLFNYVTPDATKACNYWLDNITDEVYETECRMSGEDYLFAKKLNDTTGEYYTDGTKAYVELAYDLGKATDIKNIQFLNAGRDCFRTNKYKVYASDLKDNLFENENLLCDFQNSDKARKQTFRVNDGKSLTAQYIGFKVTDVTCCHEDNDITNVLKSTPINNYLRLRGIAVIAKKTADDFVVRGTFADDNEAALPTFDADSGIENLTEGTTPEYYINRGSDDILTTPSSDENFDSITNGVVSNSDGAMLKSLRFFTKSGNNYTSMKEIYSTALSFDLGKVCDVNAFAIVNHNIDALRNYHYIVYASDSKDTLWSDTSYVAEYFNKQKTRRQVLSFNSVSARYVGVRFYDPTSDYNNVNYFPDGKLDQSYVRIGEIAVFGSERGSIFGATADDTLETDTTLGVSNLVKNSKPAKITYYSDYGNSVSNNPPVSGPDRLTDGDYKDNWRVPSAVFAEYDAAAKTSKYIGKDITEGKYYLDITMSLGGKKTITGFELFHSKAELATQHYSVYISQKEEDLFKPASRIIDYTNTDGNRRNTFKLLDGETAPEGQYFGIRILDPTHGKGIGNAVAYSEGNGQNYVYPRINEITVYGDGLVEAVAEDNVGALPDNLGDNIALNMGYAANYYDGTTYSSAIVSGSSKLTDGIATTGNEVRFSGNKMAYYNNGNPLYVGKGIDDGSIYADILFDFGAKSDITDIAVINSGFRWSNTYHYALFIGDDKAQMFSGTPFKDYVNKDSYQRQIFNLNMINGGNAVKARYVGIRIYDPTFEKGVDAASIVTEETNNIYVRLREIAIYGKQGNVEDSNVIFDDIDRLPVSWGNNMIINKEFKTYWYDGNERKIINFGGSENLNDGDPSTEARSSAYKFADYDEKHNVVLDYTSNGTGKRYEDVVFDLRSEIQMDAYALIHSKTQKVRTGHYKIYISNAKSELFDEKNCVSEVKNTASSARTAENFAKSGKDYKGRYVGVRILNPVTGVNVDAVTTVDASNAKDNNIYMRLREFAVYGSYTDPNYVYAKKFEPIKTSVDKSFFTKPGKSLILNKTPSEIYSNGIKLNQSVCTADKAGLGTDGDPETSYDFRTEKLTARDGSQTLDLIWDLSGAGHNYSFTQAIFMGLKNGNPPFYMGWYRIYISDDYDLLFEDDSIAFEYNAIDEENPDELCCGASVKFAKPITGCYVGLRYLCANYSAETSNYARIREFAIYGTEAPVDNTPFNLASSMPVNAYLEQNDGSLKEVDESNLTAKEISNLTDGNTSTKATVNTGKKTLHMLYNLCQDTDISAIYLTNGAALSTIKSYKVYAASSLADVWQSKSLVYTYKGGGSAAKTGRTFTPSKNMRYVRFEIIGSGSEITISEIEIAGFRRNALRNKNLSKNIADSNYVFYEQNLKTGKIDYLNIENRNVMKIHDGVTGNPIGIEAGDKNGNSTVNILVDLTDLKTINGFSVSFAKRAWPYMPTKTNVYIGDNLDIVEDVNTKPTYTFNGLPKNSEISKSFSPRLGRYVRISFVSGGDSNGVFSRPVYAVGEVTVNGTAVHGMNTNQPNVIDFEDAKLGVKWGIVRNGNNDIYTNVATSSVTVSKVTNWQKNSLNKSPYLKVVGDKKYTFRFYDMTGKEVRQFEGRDIQIMFKHRDGMADGTAMIGYAGNKWYIQPNETDNLNGYSIMTDVVDADRTFCYSMLCMTSSTDPYWSNIGKLEDYGDEEPQYPPTTELDKNYSSAAIVTEDKNFSIKPRGALRLPIDSVLSVDVATGTIDATIYNAVAETENANNIAVTYHMSLTQSDMNYAFDGQVKTQLQIPEVIKGYFSNYKLMAIDDNGTAREVDYTRNGDYITFVSNAVDDYALVGDQYHPDKDAVYTPDTNGNGSPATGESRNNIFLYIAIASFVCIVLLNSKKLRAAR